MLSRILTALVLVGLPALVGAQCTIKQKDGKVVKGRVDGYVVQRGADIKGETHTISYNVIPGDALESIDEKGVNLRPGAQLKLVVVRQSPPKDDDFNVSFAHGFMDIPSDVRLDIQGIGPLAITTVGGKNLTDQLIGEFRVGADRKGALAADIQVTTGTGVVSIPVAAIVKFAPAKPAKP
ncbi:MAG: hypothetical protein ACYC3F_10575 [Gemmatimonadaceae bacterium]